MTAPKKSPPAKRATAAKKPADRQVKAKDRPAAFDITVRGVDLSIPFERFDDFELMFDMQTIDHGSDQEGMATLVDVFARLLGLDEAKAFIKAAAAGSRLDVEAGVGLINEVFEALSEVRAPNS